MRVPGGSARRGSARVDERADLEALCTEVVGRLTTAYGWKLDAPARAALAQRVRQEAEAAATALPGVAEGTVAAGAAGAAGADETDQGDRTFQRSIERLACRLRF